MLSIIQLARGYFRCLISFQNWNLSRNFLALFHGRNSFYQSYHAGNDDFSDQRYFFSLTSCSEVASEIRQILQAKSCSSSLPCPTSAAICSRSSIFCAKVFSPTLRASFGTVCFSVQRHATCECLVFTTTSILRLVFAPFQRLYRKET